MHMGANQDYIRSVICYCTDKEGRTKAVQHVLESFETTSSGVRLANVSCDTDSYKKLKIVWRNTESLQSTCLCGQPWVENCEEIEIRIRAARLQMGHFTVNTTDNSKTGTKHDHLFSPHMKEAFFALKHNITDFGHMTKTFTTQNVMMQQDFRERPESVCSTIEEIDQRKSLLQHGKLNLDTEWEVIEDYFLILQVELDKEKSGPDYSSKLLEASRYFLMAYENGYTGVSRKLLAEIKLMEDRINSIKENEARASRKAETKTTSKFGRFFKPRSGK